MDSKILKKEINISELLNYVNSDINEKCINCQNYNNNHSCPSFDFNIIDFLNEYSKCILYGKKFFTEEELLNFKLSDEMYKQFKAELLKKYKKDVNNGLNKLEKMMNNANAIYVSHCDYCDRCALLDGKNCYFPMLSHYSMEALNIDVKQILKKEFNEELDIPINHKMDKYIILLGMILKK